jgi:hypothetical protein
MLLLLLLCCMHVAGWRLLCSPWTPASLLTGYSHDVAAAAAVACCRLAAAVFR